MGQGGMGAGRAVSEATTKQETRQREEVRGLSGA